MKKYNALYYLLFILLIMGAFASMAQNSYGMKIIGIVAFVFGFAFFMESVNALQHEGKKNFASVAEPACLFVVAVIFGLRVFYIHFPFIEWIFGLAAMILVIIYARRMIHAFHYYNERNKVLGILMSGFYLSIILFLLSLALSPFLPKSAEAAGIAAFVLMLAFIIISLFNKSMLVDGEKISAFSAVRSTRDYSIIIVAVFLLFSLYVGLNRFGVIPAVYSDQYPKAYFELVNNASSKKEKPVDGRYRHEVFMEKYREFVKKLKTGK